MPFTVIQHPLASHILTSLRDETTKPAAFRMLCNQVTLLLTLEATRNLPTRENIIRTPLESHAGRVLDQPLAVVPILRAGLGMLEPIVDLFPDVSVGYIGLERCHDTAVARSYYCKLPPLAKRHTLLVDPMLATGGSAVQALNLLVERGAKDISLLCIVAAPEGVAEVQRHYPELPIYSAALDRCLNDKKYILPGLGDFGDRLYGT